MKNKHWIFFAGFFGFVSCVALGLWTYNWYSQKEALQKLKSYNEKGYDALAVDLLDKYRTKFSASEEGCQQMINTYFRVKAPALLEWTAQSCLENKIETPTVYLGFAKAKELVKDSDRALGILAESLKKYENDVNLLFSAGVLLKNMNRLEEAGAVLKKAATAEPQNAVVATQAFHTFYEMSNWNEAYTFAKLFSTENINDVGFTLRLARVYMKNGDVEKATAAKEKSVSLISKLHAQGYAESLKPLETDFAAELKGNIASMSKNSTRAPASN